MGLKRKLVTSFLLVSLIPMVMVLIIGRVITMYQLNSIEQTFEMSVDTAQIISNPIMILNRVTRGVYNRITYMAVQNGYTLEQVEYIEELDRELDKNYSFLMLRKGDEIVYTGNMAMTELIIDSLPPYGAYHTDAEGGMYISGKASVLLKQQDFLCSDGTKGTVFVITDVTKMVPQIRVSAVQAVISFAAILLITGIILCAWLYRGIIFPLNRLKTATRKMKEGNLDFSLENNGKDEIGQLCDDFDEMRCHMKELIEARVAHEREIMEMISSISHDLKTPLTAIKGYTEGIIDGVADSPERMDKYIRTIYTKANDMSVLVDELLFYSKIDFNTMPYNFTPIKVSEYFNDCVAQLKLDLEVKKIQLLYENKVGPFVTTMADPEQLKRVVTNIVSNSVKYMGGAGNSEYDLPCIKIRLNEAELYIKIEIEDNGTGIAEKDLPHIFERFFRADAARSTKFGGTGLGLSIAKKIINDHEGSIWATSKLGYGTTVYITLNKL